MAVGGAVLDTVTGEGLTKEGMFEQRPEKVRKLCVFQEQWG